MILLLTRLSLLIKHYMLGTGALSWCVLNFQRFLLLADTVLLMLAVLSGLTCPWFLGVSPDCFFFFWMSLKHQKQHNAQIKAQTDSFIQFNTVAQNALVKPYIDLFSIQKHLQLFISVLLMSLINCVLCVCTVVTVFVSAQGEIRVMKFRQLLSMLITIYSL